MIICNAVQDMYVSMSYPVSDIAYFFTYPEFMNRYLLSKCTTTKNPYSYFYDFKQWHNDNIRHGNIFK